MPRVLSAGWSHCATGDGLCLADRTAPLRSPESQATPGRGRLSQGFDAGDFTPNPGFPIVAESVVNYLNAVGIRVRMRTMERATFLSVWRDKKLRGVVLAAVGASGNAATRAESFMYSKGTYAYGGYPDIDALFEQQAVERDRTKREALLHRIQQLTIEHVMFAPIMDLRALIGVGPRLAEHTINSIPVYPFPALEDVTLKQ